jgi:ribose/xylose/arabinose/galactoside ABC-type transport system permease subunit
VGVTDGATAVARRIAVRYLDRTGDPNTADGLESRVIAAVVIGGGA